MQRVNAFKVGCSGKHCCQQRTSPARSVPHFFETTQAAIFNASHSAGEHWSLICLNFKKLTSLITETSTYFGNFAGTASGRYLHETQNIAAPPRTQSCSAEHMTGLQYEPGPSSLQPQQKVFTCSCSCMTASGATQNVLMIRTFHLRHKSGAAVQTSALTLWTLSGSAYVVHSACCLALQTAPHPLKHTC